MGANKLMKNDMFTNVALVILVILTFNYLNTRQYQATIFMYIVAVAGYYMCKSLSCGLLAAIVLTNLLISMNYFKISENLVGGKKSKKEEPPKPKKEETPNPKKEDTPKPNIKKNMMPGMPDLTDAIKQLEVLGINRK